MNLIVIDIRGKGVQCSSPFDVYWQTVYVPALYCCWQKQILITMLNVQPLMTGMSSELRKLYASGEDTSLEESYTNKNKYYYVLSYNYM